MQKRNSPQCNTSVRSSVLFGLEFQCLSNKVFKHKERWDESSRNKRILQRVFDGDCFSCRLTGNRSWDDECWDFYHIKICKKGEKIMFR